MKLEISFPVKIVLGVVLVILIPLVVMGTAYIAQGKVAFTSSIPGTFVVDEETGQIVTVPATITKRTGKRTFTLEAPGYATEQVTILFPTFRLTKKYVINLDKKLYDEEDPNSRAKVPLASVLPHTEADFSIDFPDESGTYPITLAPDLIVVPGVSDKALDKAIREDKEKALAWLRSQNIDPNSLKIEWLPYDPDQ